MNDPGIDFDLLLTNHNPDDSFVISAVIRHYYAPISYLANVIFLEGNKAEIASKKAIFEVLTKLNEFNPGTNFTVWVLKIAAQACFTYRRKQKIHEFFNFFRRKKIQKVDEQNKHQEIKMTFFHADLGDLNLIERLVLVLNSTYSLFVPDIAEILQKRDNIIQVNLERIYSTKFSDISIDGQNESIENRFEKLPSFAIPPDNFYNSLVQEFFNQPKQNKIKKRPLVVSRSWGELVFVGIVLSILLIFGINASHQPSSGEVAMFLTATPPLPSPVAPEIGQFFEHNIAANSVISQTSDEPAMSADGQIVAFSSNNSLLVTGDKNGVSDIFVYNHNTSEIQRISVSTNSEEANGPSFVPDISDDGRWVTFSSKATNLNNEQNTTCQKELDQSPCTQIYVHNRYNGITEIVSVSDKGVPGNNDSSLPVISGDGRFIAYWSTADNLGQPTSEYCEIGQVRLNCLDIILFDRATKSTTRIPIGKHPAKNSLYRLDISSDGRRLVFPIFSDDKVASNLGLTNPVDIYTYDLKSQSFLAVNVDNEGIPGNNASFNPSISSDGRYVAFTSLANNLVEQDKHEDPDIFVRDLDLGITQWISKENNKREGNVATLSSFWTANWNELVNISSNGRWVVFLSNSTGLLTDNTSIWCGPTLRTPWTCYGVFIYDRQSDDLSPLNIPSSGKLDSGGTILLSPAISNDGRWLSFVGFSWSFNEHCLEGGCSEIFLYDRHEGETLHVSKSRVQSIANSEKWYFWKNISGHENWTNSIAFSPDGQLLVSVGNDGVLNVWDANNLEQIYSVLEDHKFLQGVAFSPDSSKLAIASNNGRVIIRDPYSGVLVDILEIQDGPIQDLEFSPIGNLLAVATSQAVWLWEVEEGTFRFSERFPYPKTRIISLAFSPENTILATGHNDGSIWLRKVTTGKVLYRLEGHDGKILDLEFSPNKTNDAGKIYLASASDDNWVHVWEMKIIGENVTLQYQSSMSHNDWVKSLAFSPDGALLATGSFDSNVGLWHIPEGDPLQTLRRTSQDQVLSLDFSGDGNTLAIGTVRGQVRLWSKGLKDGQSLQTSKFFDRTASNKYIDNYIGRLFYPSPATNDPFVVFTFKEAKDLVSFEFQTPEQVPEDFTLEAILVLKPPTHPFEAVTMSYIHTSSFQPAVLIITQSLENPKHFGQRIGQDAQITEIRVRDQMVEHVQGGWSFDQTLADNGGNVIAFQQIWDPESATQWLRWQEEEVFFSVRFENPYNDSLISNLEQLTLEDIITFVEGFH